MHNSNRKSLSSLVCLIALLAFFIAGIDRLASNNAFASETATAGKDAPNIVVILADDLGWNAVGYHNQEFETPNLDQLVAEGVELNRFYVAPMCSPTRAGFMTGRYPIRFGCARAVIPPQRDFGLPLDETTVAEVLGKLGYANRGVFGKWHLGHRRAKWHPLNRGFTHFHGHYNGAIDYFTLMREEERDWHTNFDTSNQQGYSTDLIADAAADWIEQSAKQEAPYFCYTAFNAPHSPFQAPKQAIERFKHLNDSGKRGGKKKPSARLASNRQTYGAMIWKMDQGIGKILRAIEASGESNRTLVWFFSDNGGVGGIRDNNQPLRGSKLTVYEGGIRVTAAVKWPGKIEPGTSTDEICGYIDMLPTLVTAAGGDPQQIASKPLDGLNVMSVLTNDAEAIANHPLRTRPWYSYHGQSGAQSEHLSVTSDGWKLKVNGPQLQSIEQLTDGTNDVELFRLQKDLLESRDVKDAHPDIVQRLGEMLVEYRALQPENAVTTFRVGKEGFVPPVNWKLDPSQPDALVGHHE